MSKLLLSDFWNYILEYDIFIMSETWIEDEKCQLFNNYLKQYTVKFDSATRVSRFGHASGGFLLGYKSKLKSVSFQYRADKAYIQIRTQNNVFKIVPVYINCSHWPQDLMISKTFFNSRTKIIY